MIKRNTHKKIHPIFKPTAQEIVDEVVEEMRKREKRALKEIDWDAMRRRYAKDVELACKNREWEEWK